MYAHVVDNRITRIGRPPRLLYDGTRWWDLRTPAPEQLAQHGWLPVTTVPRPEDTETHTHDLTHELIDGTPTQVWVERPWTAQELTNRARLADHEARITRLEALAFPPEPDPEPDDITHVKTFSDWGGVVPDGGLLRGDGQVWRNVSGGLLTHAPSMFPGWDEGDLAHLWAKVMDTTTEPDPDPEVPEWSPSATYVPGDLVTRDGITYRCLVAHGPEQQGGWGPPATGVWEQAG
jgi:hypothetical protein